MRKYYSTVKNLATSKTATDTYVLFAGRLLSAFLGFVFVLVVTRVLSIEEFGIYSAAANLVAMMVAFTDIGLSTGVVNFVSEFLAKKNRKKELEYLKAAVVMRTGIIIVAALIIALFAGFVSKKFIAADEKIYAYWVALLILGFFAWDFFQYVLQAYKRFLASIIVDNTLVFIRLVVVLLFVWAGSLTLQSTFLAYFVGTASSLVAIAYLVKFDYLKARPDKAVYKNLIKYSGWVGVNRIISSISGRLDVLMLAGLSGAAAVGTYSVAQRLAMFLSILTASYGSVLAPRLSSIGDREKEKNYLIKATIGTIPMVFGIIFWIIIAYPFITILFGDKYSGSVPIFQVYALSMIPFMLAAPAVVSIIYAMKRTRLIGIFSFFQIGLVFVLNFILIPIYGPIGPTITFGVLHTILLIYAWYFVVRYYWVSDK